MSLKSRCRCDSFMYIIIYACFKAKIFINIWLIFVALRCSCKLAVSTRSSCFNLFPVTSNTLVFLVLMYNLISVDRFSIFSKSLERALVKEVIFSKFALKDRVVSSAYISMVELYKCKGISFTNRRNKKGPRIDPCSAPYLTGFGWDGICPSFINCRQPARYDWNQATPFGLAPYKDNFFNNRFYWVRQKLYGNQ